MSAAPDAQGAAWKSLHPASVLVNLLPTVWAAIRSMWPLLAAIALGSSQRRLLSFDAVLLGVFLVLPVWRTVVHWLTLRYRVEQGRLEIRTGVLNRQTRTIPPDRIQNVESVRNVFHRMSGLVEVRVETASGGDIEGQLSALSEADADALKTALDQARARYSAPAADERENTPPLLTNGVSDLLRYGLSSAQFGLVIVGAGVVYELVLSDPLQAQEGAAVLGVMGGGAAVVGLMTGAWLLGAGRALMRHWDFRLTAVGNRLIAEEGLLTRRTVELTVRKIQLVTYREPLIRRWLGFGSLRVETAGRQDRRNPAGRGDGTGGLTGGGDLDRRETGARNPGPDARRPAGTPASPGADA